jgi:hypothetical protein
VSPFPAAHPYTFCSANQARPTPNQLCVHASNEPQKVYRVLDRLKETKYLFEITVRSGCSVPQASTTQPLLFSISEAIKVPPVEVSGAYAVGWLVCGGVALEIERCASGDVRIQLNVKSQFVVVHLGRLQQTADLHSSLTLLLLCLGCRLLALFREELSVVARELLE